MNINIGTTIFNHLLYNQTINPQATGSFTQLFIAIVVAAKLIQRDVSMAGLADVLGRTGNINIQGEEIQKLDSIANAILKRKLASCGEICTMVSEEEADLIDIPQKYPKGPYLVHFDPLDGSSNIDANVSIGTIFSIYKRITPDDRPATSEDALQAGIKQVAAGYVIYGSSCIFVFTTGNGVNGFTLDPAIGEFILSHPNIMAPKNGNIYSINEANYAFWDKGTQKYINCLKNPNQDNYSPYTSRYVGSLVADFHRNLLYGGVYLYPADTKDPTKPNGKLRLMCEANPLAFIIEQAGGLASTGTERILDIIPKHIHQRVPLAIGSYNNVKMYEKFLKENIS